MGLLARNGDELADEGTSTTTRRNKTLEIRESTYNLWIEQKEALCVQGITNIEFAAMLLHQNLGIATDRGTYRYLDIQAAIFRYSGTDNLRISHFSFDFRYSYNCKPTNR